MNEPGIYRFNGYSIFKLGDNMIRLEFEDGFNGTIEDAKQQVAVIEQIKDKGKCLLLVIFKDDNTFTRETREYMSSDTVSRLVMAGAYVVEGLALRIFINGYIRINKPMREIKTFHSEAEAISWLKGLQPKP